MKQKCKKKYRLYRFFEYLYVLENWHLFQMVAKVAPSSFNPASLPPKKIYSKSFME